MVLLQPTVGNARRVVLFTVGQFVTCFEVIVQCNYSRGVKSTVYIFYTAVYKAHLQLNVK